MTKTSTFKFFIQEIIENDDFSLEKIKNITAVIKQPTHVSSTVQCKEQAHQAIQAAFDGLYQSVHETHFAHHQVNQGDGQVHATNNQAHVLEVPVVTELDKTVLEYLQAFFQSDRSSYELLKLINRLLKLRKAYIKKAK